MSSTSLPEPLRRLFSSFPLHTYPAVYVSHLPTHPTLWVLPSKSSSSGISSDVECLRWQTYIILRGISNIRTRTDIVEEAGAEGRLPSLHLPSGELIAAQHIATWIDQQAATPLGELEGFKDMTSRDESRAWISLLEGPVRAELVRRSFISQGQRLISMPERR